MAKVLNELPTGSPLKPPSGPPKTTRESMKGSARGASISTGEAPKGIRREKNKSGGWLNTLEGMEWQARRCEAFGIAASRYFHKRDRPAGALKKD